MGLNAQLLLTFNVLDIWHPFMPLKNSLLILSLQFALQDCSLLK